MSKLENYTSLFDNTEEMLNSEQIIKVLKTLQKKQPEIYCGKGEFKRLTIEFKEALIKSFVHIAPSDFSLGCTNKPQ